MESVSEINVIGKAFMTARTNVTIDNDYQGAYILVMKPTYSKRLRQIAFEITFRVKVCRAANCALNIVTR